jgi:hypothetical protein
MFRGDLGVNNINGIPVMSFSNLNSIISNQYPGYRDKESYISLARLAAGGSMSTYTIGNGLYKNLNSTFYGDSKYNKREKIVSPPAYENKINLPVKNI